MGTASKRLAKGRRMRRHTASTFRSLEMGHIDIVEVLRHPPKTLRRVSIFDVLRRAPRLGRKGAENVLQKANQWPLKKLGEIDLQDREKVIACLPPRARA